MSAGEVLWRVGQKARQAQELAVFGRRHRRVDTPLYRAAGRVSFDPAPLGLVVDSAHIIDTSHDIRLLGGYDYAEYSTDWHAGFQTAARWPLTWSPALEYKQRDDIGDARTNWELNRHAQFVLMAKAWYLTADETHLDTLEAQLDSWTEANPFLWGISWTSPMEIALRAINWLYSAAFLRASDETAEDSGRVDRLVGRLATGAANMASYLAAHYSRGSSANNHLLVEMAALWLAGASLGHKGWCDTALATMSRELPRQFAPDGVNREMSLHYHAFAMEAYLLVAHSLAATGRAIPRDWAEPLGRGAEFIAHSRVAPGVMCVFGDDDEGHILDFSSRKTDYYTYILQFCSLFLNRRYDSLDELNPTLAWLCRADAVVRVENQPLADTGGSRTFDRGGYSMLRRGPMFVGMDHAPLGFGSIAAHGHADALSFQLFIDGRPVLADPGTYIYHVDLPSRDKFRSTAMHNTVVIEGREQSEMLGAFLWGKRAETRLDEADAHSVKATTVTAAGDTHTRRITLGEDMLTVHDTFGRECAWSASFILAPGIEARQEAGAVKFGQEATLTFTSGEAVLDKVDFSAAYGMKEPVWRIRVNGKGDTAVFEIRKTQQS